MSIDRPTLQDIASPESREREEQKYALDSNEEFLGFQNVEITKIDDTKPWEPALEVKVTKADGSVAESLDANTPFFTFRDSEGNEMTVTAAVAGHIDKLHIKGEDAGSKFDYPSLETLFEDVAKKLPQEVASAAGVSDFAIDMEHHMGKEGVASMEELKAEGILTDSDLSNAESVRAEVEELNKSGDDVAKKAFVEKYKLENPDCKVQFQLVRGTVLVPIVDIAKRDTTKLFMVFGPGADGKKTAYTMAPGRHMPRHPNPGQHKDKEGVLNEGTFKESADAWFDTVMLTGK
ncbi:hypothetical protein L6279_03930 [Candidatus Parcubacteria bacterium]|nr:hypothetical protein [Candidatus Parcubacteria bacterium]